MLRFGDSDTTSCYHLLQGKPHIADEFEEKISSGKQKAIDCGYKII